MQREKEAVIIITTHPNCNFHLLQIMKTVTETRLLDKMTLTAVVSCFCSTVYFLVVNLLA